MPRKPAPKSKFEAAIQPPTTPILLTTELRVLLIVLRATGFLFAVLCLWGWSDPESRLWGFHFFAYLPKIIAIPLFGLAVILLTPLGEKIISFLSTTAKFLRNRKSWVWGFVAIIVFFGLHVSEPLLGDGQLWIRELSWIGEFEFQGTMIPADRTFKRKEPLSLLLHEGVFLAAAEFFPPDKPLSGLAGAQAQIEKEKRLDHFRELATQTYRWMSFIAGGFLIVMLVRFSRRFIATENRTIFFTALFVSGAWLLFFGYIENYSWSSVWILLCLLFGVEESFPPRRFPWKTVASFLLAVGFHFASIILGPAVFYLMMQLHFQERDKKSGNDKMFRLRSTILTASILVVLIAGYVWVEAWEGWISIMPLLPEWTKDGYAMLTMKHLQDLLNLLPHVCGLGLVLWITFRTVTGKSSADKLQRGFLTYAAVAGILFVLVFTPNLGMARDWDLLAVSLWPVVLLGAWRISQVNFAKSRITVLSILTGIVLLVAVPVVLVNALYQPSIARFKTLLALDASRSAYGWENLALHYQRRGEIENRIDAWKHAIIAERNPRYVFNYADAIKLAGRPAEAAPFYLEAAGKNPDYSVQLLYLAATLAGKENFDLATTVIDSAAVLRPDDSNVPRLKAWIQDAKQVNSLMRNGRWEEAKSAVIEAQRKDPSNSYWKERLAEIKKEMK